MKSTLLSKGSLLLVMLERRFHTKILGNVSKKLWAVEHHCSLSSLYSTCKKEILNCTHTLLAIHWAVFIKTLHSSLIPDSCNLVSCPIVGNHSNFRKYWFHVKQSHKRFGEQVLNKWMHFQNILSLQECSKSRHVAREIA